MLQKLMAKKNKKGFTLVEIIVVLVILAIMMAVLIPTLTGYIDKANENMVRVEGRSALLAAQTLASEAYGKQTAVPTADAIETLAEVAKGTISGVTIVDGKVTALVYKGKGYTATYTAGTWDVQKTTKP